MHGIAKIEGKGGLFCIRLLPAGVRGAQIATAQPSYKLAVRHVKTRFPGFRIVDAKTFDQEQARRASNQPLAKEGLNA